MREIMWMRFHAGTFDFLQTKAREIFRRRKIIYPQSKKNLNVELKFISYVKKLPPSK